MTARAAADAAGWSGHFGKEERRAEGEARREAEEARVKVEGGVKIDSNVTVKIDSDPNKLAEMMGQAITHELKPAIDDIYRKIAETNIRIREELSRRSYNATSQRAASSR